MQQYYAYFGHSTCHYKLECKIRSQEGFLRDIFSPVKHLRTWRENRIIFVFVNRQIETVTINLEHNN